MPGQTLPVMLFPAMPIPIPLGEKVTATVTAQAVRDVTCEKCGCAYVYVVRATATGGGENLLFLNESRARSRARSQANVRVRDQLRQLYRPVWCPDCGNYQAHMVKLLKRRRIIQLACIAAAPLLWVVLKYCMSDAATWTEAGLPFWSAVAAALAVAGAIYHLTRDDNAKATERAQRDPTGGGAAMRKADFEKLAAANAPGNAPAKT